jgi:hypothetical protein
VPLTASLQADLERLASAHDEAGYEAALTDAANRIQATILNWREGGDMPSLSALPFELRPLLEQVLERAISTHVLVDGSVLRLWMLPVLLETSGLQRKIIGAPAGLPFLRLTAALHAHLRMAGTNGWIHGFPTLLSENHRQQMPLARLVEIPRQTREAIRGSARLPVFDDVESSIDPPGREMATHYLPFVSYHYDRSDVVAEAASPELIRRVRGWIFSSGEERANGLRMVWVGKPRLFSQTAGTGYATWPFWENGFPQLGRH